MFLLKCTYNPKNETLEKAPEAPKKALGIGTTTFQVQVYAFTN